VKWFFGGAIEWINDYGAILFGLMLGAVAHFGRKLTTSEPIVWREALGFLMQLGVIGLLASVATREMGITDDDTRALTTAIMALSAQEVLQYLKRNGWAPTIDSVLPGGKKD
jgi:hypothetical protein